MEIQSPQLTQTVNTNNLRYAVELLASYVFEVTRPLAFLPEAMGAVQACVLTVPDPENLSDYLDLLENARVRLYQAVVEHYKENDRHAEQMTDALMIVQDTIKAVVNFIYPPQE